MNKCQRLVRMLTEEERRSISLSKFSPIERQIFRIYSRETQEITIDQLAERLQVHKVHISRVNSQLLQKIATAYASSDLRLYLTLFRRADLYPSLFKEIRSIEETIVASTPQEEKLKLYNCFFVVLSGIPPSPESIELYQYLLQRCTHHSSAFPPGHIDAFELIVLVHGMFYQKMCLVHATEILQFKDNIQQRLEDYTSRGERVANVFLNLRLHVAYSFYYALLSPDSAKFKASCEQALQELDAIVEYRFTPYNSLDVVHLRLEYLSFLTRTTEYIGEYQRLDEHDQKILLTPNVYSNVEVDYVGCLLIMNQIDTLVSFTSWYVQFIEQFPFIHPNWQMKVHYIKLITALSVKRYDEAREILSALRQLNKRPHYRRGADLLSRIRECQIFIFENEFTYAEQSMRTTLKWAKHQKIPFPPGWVGLLEAYEAALQYQMFKEKRLIAKWKRKLSILQQNGIMPEYYFLDRVAEKLGLPKTVWK